MIESRPEKNKLGPALQEHLQGQILVILTAGAPVGRLNLVCPQAGIKILP